MALSAGRRLGTYEILAPIGAGAMGEVYRARDTKLGRDVAIKVLPEGLARDKERRARFEREAWTVAALNHPNIVTVHAIDEVEGIHFITLELVRGKTLSALIPNRGFPLDQFYDLALQLIDVVAAANDAGITHRDLKPNNVMVTEDGHIKVLDFGLAKGAAGFAAESAYSDLPTVERTAAGAIVGTLHYMSPEQAQPVDARSDIFSMASTTLIWENVGYPCHARPSIGPGCNGCRGSQSN